MMEKLRNSKGSKTQQAADNDAGAGGDENRAAGGASAETAIETAIETANETAIEAADGSNDDGLSAPFTPARNGFFNIAWGVAYKIMTVIVLLTILGLLTGTPRDHHNIAVLLSERPSDEDIANVEAVINNLGLTIRPNRAARFPPEGLHRIWLRQQINRNQAILVPIITENQQTFNVNAIMNNFNRVMETLDEGPRLDIADAEDADIEEILRSTRHSVRVTRRPFAAHGEVEQPILNYDLRERKPTCYASYSDDEDDSDAKLESDSGSGAYGNADSGEASDKIDNSKKVNKRSGRRMRAHSRIRNPIRGSATARAPRRLTLQEQQRMFLLDIPVLRSGILFMNLDVIPMRLPLVSEDKPDKPDPEISVRLGAEINKWLNSDEFTEKILEICEMNEVKRGLVKKMPSQQHGLFNDRYDVIEKDQFCNLYTGLITNSYETKKGKKSDGVLSNRKMACSISISKNGRKSEKHNIIQIGWRFDDECCMPDRINARIPGYAEMANHACDPNCQFVDLEDPIESYPITIDGDTYTVRYYPTYLVAVRDIARGEEMTADYNNDIVAQSYLTVEACNKALRKGGEDAIRALARGMDMRLCRKSMKKLSAQKTKGFDCACDFCGRMNRICGRPLARLFMVDDHGVDYGRLSSILLGNRNHLIAVRDRQQFFEEDGETPQRPPTKQWSYLQLFKRDMSREQLTDYRNTQRRTAYYAKKGYIGCSGRAVKRLLVRKTKKKSPTLRRSQAAFSCEKEDLSYADDLRDGVESVDASTYPLPEEPTEDLVRESNALRESCRKDQAHNSGTRRDSDASFSHSSEARRVITHNCSGVTEDIYVDSDSDIPLTLGMPIHGENPGASDNSDIPVQGVPNHGEVSLSDEESLEGGRIQRGAQSLDPCSAFCLSNQSWSPPSAFGGSEHDLEHIPERTPEHTQTDGDHDLSVNLSLDTSDFVAANEQEIDVIPETPRSDD